MVIPWYTRLAVCIQGLIVGLHINRQSRSLSDQVDGSLGKGGYCGQRVHTCQNQHIAVKPSPFNIPRAVGMIDASQHTRPLYTSLLEPLKTSPRWFVTPPYPVPSLLMLAPPSRWTVASSWWRPLAMFSVALWWLLLTLTVIIWKSHICSCASKKLLEHLLYPFEMLRSTFCRTPQAQLIILQGQRYLVAVMRHHKISWSPLKRSVVFIRAK